MKQDEIEIKITLGGVIRSIHDDEITPILATLGRLTVGRASHVEPDPNDQSRWRVADRDGQDQGVSFPTRALALAWERENFWRLIQSPES